MKKMLLYLITALLLAGLTACASVSYQSGTDKELHPGHVGHEVH